MGDTHEVFFTRFCHNPVIVILYHKGKNTMKPFDRFLTIMLRPWIAVAYLAFAMLSFVYFDKPLAEYFHGLSLTTRFPALHWLTVIGVGFIYMVFFFLLALFFRFVSRNKIAEMRSWFLWLCVLLPNCITLFFKIVLGRARPELLFDDKLYGFYGLHFTRQYWSFPSGHTTSTMALIFGLGIVFPRYFYWFLFSGIVIIATRVLLTQHYLSDVMMTSYLVLLEIGLLLLYSRRKNYLMVQSLG